MVSPSKLRPLLISHYMADLVLPSMKLDKSIVQRCLDLMAAERVVGHPSLCPFCSQLKLLLRLSCPTRT